MIKEIEKNLVSQKFNAYAYAYDSKGDLTGFYKKALHFEVLNQLDNLNTRKTIFGMLQSFSNTDLISIIAITSQSVTRNGVTAKRPPVLFMSYRLVDIIDADIIDRYY